MSRMRKTPPHLKTSPQHNTSPIRRTATPGNVNSLAGTPMTLLRFFPEQRCTPGVVANASFSLSAVGGFTTLAGGSRHHLSRGWRVGLIGIAAGSAVQPEVELALPVHQLKLLPLRLFVGRHYVLPASG